MFQSAILAFSYLFGFNLKKKSCRNLQSTDGIIDVYIIDGVEGLDYSFRSHKTDFLFLFLYYFTIYIYLFLTNCSFKNITCNPYNVKS